MAEGLQQSLRALGLVITSYSIHYTKLYELGERLERGTQYMRGYLLRDGKLNISLMADGGIYVWEPQPASQ